MAEKLLRIGAAGYDEVELTTVSLGAADAGKGVATGPDGRLHQSLMPKGIGPDTYTGVANEAIPANSFVYIRNDGKIALASAAVGGNRAQAFAPTAIASGATDTVYFEGPMTGLTGLTAGLVYLSDVTPGGFIQTVVTGTGKLYQSLGTAVGSTIINVEIDTKPTTRA